MEKNMLKQVTNYEYDLKVKILCKVLEKIPPNSVFHLDEDIIGSTLQFFPEFKFFFKFEIFNERKLYNSYYFFYLNPLSISWLKEYIQSHNILDTFSFYRIYNKEKTETFLRVYDIDSYEVSKSLNIEEAVIEEWNSRQGQGCYWGMSDHIPYTEELIE